jgi:hypothetical protein
MNTDRTIILENISTQSIGLKDTQGRTYHLGVGAKVRISEVSLQDILDYPASRIIFNEGYCKISNISADSLYKMGLTEAEIEKFSDADLAPQVIITEEIKEEKEEVVVKKPAAKKTTTSTTKKTSSTTKKSTAKKSA